MNLESIDFNKYKMSKYFFVNGRTALKYGLLSFNIKPKDEILLPNYICDVMLIPLKQLSIKPVFYDLDELFEPKINSLKKNITSKTKAFVLVHYFGIPINYERYREFCKKNKIIFIEDNAHGFGSIINNKLIGYKSDFTIMSPWKSLDLDHGGILMINSKKKVDYGKISKYKNNSFYKLLKAIKRPLKKISFIKKIIRNQPEYWKMSNNKNEKLIDMLLDDWSKKKIINVNLREHSLKRQKMFMIWYNYIKEDKNIFPIFKSIENNASPLFFPALTKNKLESKKWFNWGWENGIDVKSWPSLPKLIYIKDKKILEKWERLVFFPIESYWNPKYLNKKLNKLKKQFR